MNHCKVVIDPSCRIRYSSYYVKGLYEVFGERNVTFSRKYFKQLKRKIESHSYDHYMAFVVLCGNKSIKYVIDFRDKNSVKQSAYEWCDKYAKINFSYQLTDKYYHKKMMSIPPGFGIKIWGRRKMIYNSIMNYIKCCFTPLVSVKQHFADYYYQYRRPSIEQYVSGYSREYDESYIFMIGTLWKHKSCITGTNLNRKVFIESCRLQGVDIEGGLLASKEHEQYEYFRHVLIKEGYTVKDYVEKTKKSRFVFNTPAVHGCHGWKLGEYLAMGKAIISTPLSNELPEDFVHGKNIHFVSSDKELRDAISLLLSSNEYVINLENEARKYFDNYVSPRAVINYIVKSNLRQDN